MISSIVNVQQLVFMCALMQLTGTAVPVCTHNALSTLKVSAPEDSDDNVLSQLFCDMKQWVANEHCLSIQARTVSYMAVSLLQLMREAETHLGQLVNMLRAPGVATLPGAVAIVAVKAAGSIAQQRPFFMNKVLPVLIALGSAQVGFPRIALQCFDERV